LRKKCVRNFFGLFYRNMLHKDSEEARRQLMAQDGDQDGLCLSIS